VAERSGDRVTPCAICTVHVETRSASFLVDPQNQGQQFVSDLASKSLRRFVSGLNSKSLGRFVSDLTSKPLERFSRFDLKIGGDNFLNLTSKSKCDGFLVWVSKPADTVW
jgi:hypothetical protein